MDESDDDNDKMFIVTDSPNVKTNNRSRVRPRKRRRISSDSSTEGLPENILEVEMNLQASALKNNLDDTSVKKILKKVVTNDHVLAMVKIREEEEGSSTDEDISTLTRSKAKTVNKKLPLVTAPWNLQLNPIDRIPVKTRPEVEALIAQELPEDEDDDEYQPPHDELLSDDDTILESFSDLDSLPRTPATPRSERTLTPKVVRDGPFVIPQETASQVSRNLDLGKEEATIALRTRSKLSLSATPIEHIESSFIPPDDVPLPDVDEIWNEFLLDCLDPTSTSRIEDDDEADPEYNIAADLDANEDEEGLESTISKISKKELQDILTELCQVMPKPSPEGLNDRTQDELNSSIQNELGPRALTVNGTATGNPPHTGTQRDVSAYTSLNTTSQNINGNINGVTHRWEGKTEPVSDEEQQMSSGGSCVPRVYLGKTEPPDELQSDQQELTHTMAGLGSNEVTILIKEQQGDSGSQQQPSAPAVVQAVVSVPDVVHIEVDKKTKFLPNQLLILQQQLRQHVQLATSNFMQLCVHPTHWYRAPIYKEFLETLCKIATANPSSIVNVCNLMSAHELITTWETSVTELTPENQALVQFIADEMEKVKRRSTNRYLYTGHFPEIFMKVVANSNVFLYPYLLPAVPFGPDTSRRRSYLRSEDELIALGLEQFWLYVENNPQLYRRPRPNLPGHRWGLRNAMQLLTKHMMPWTTTKTISSHIATVRSLKDKTNPIIKFLKERKVNPVKHKLLPYNSKITLYEQPEYEMPRIWTRYLAKTSKRFKSYLFRRTHMTGVPPAGVDLDMTETARVVEKTAVPCDCAPATIYSCTQNAPQTPVTSPAMVASKLFSVVSTKQGMVLVPLEINTTTVDSNNEPICTPVESKPKNTITIDTGNIITNCNSLRPREEDTVKKVITIDAGNIITNGSRSTCKKTDTNKKMITIDAGNIINNVDIPNDDEHAHDKSERARVPKENITHCKCCELLRKICGRQTVITEYFKHNNKLKRQSCPCRDVVHPKISNKLKLLLKSYWRYPEYIHYEAERRIDGNHLNMSSNNGLQHGVAEDENDNGHVLSFLLKLTLRMNTSRQPKTNSLIHRLVSAFDIRQGDPTVLATSLGKLLGEDGVDLFKEFISFLTPEQAERLDMFDDYFIGVCFENVIKKIEEHVTDPLKRHAIFKKLQGLSMYRKTSSCLLCSELLMCFWDHPALARYLFNLFPHRRKEVNENLLYRTENDHCIISATEQRLIESETTQVLTEEGPSGDNRMNTELPSCDEEDNDTLVDESQNQVDNQTLEEEGPLLICDGSTDEEEDPFESCEEGPETLGPLSSTSVIKQENFDTQEMTITETKVQYNPDISKTSSTTETGREPYSKWKREEDKLILEVLKQSLTQEEIADKTISEIIEGKKLLQMMSYNIENKSTAEIKERALYLLQFLIVSA